VPTPQVQLRDCSSTAADWSAPLASNTLIRTTLCKNRTLTLAGEISPRNDGRSNLVLIQKHSCIPFLIAIVLHSI
jgi:hypothetical protein